MRKAFYFLLFILIFFLCYRFFYLYNPSNELESNHKVITTQNWEGDYSFRHNDDWDVRLSGPNTYVRSPDYDMSGPQPVLLDGVELSVTVNNNVGSVSLKEWIANDALYSVGSKNMADTTIINIPAIEYDFAYNGVTSRNVSFLYQDSLFTLSMHYADDKNYYNYLEEFNGMVESFTFVD